MPRVVLALLLLVTSARADDLDSLRLRGLLGGQTDEICRKCDGEGCQVCGDDGRVGKKSIIYDTKDATGDMADDTINWLTDPEARETGKPIWYHVTDSTDCPWCVKADAAFTSPEVVAASQNFACVLIDRNCKDQTAYRKWLNHYGVVGKRERYPTDVFLTANFKRFAKVNNWTPDYPDRLRLATNWATRGKARPVVVERPSFNFLPTRSQSVCGPNGCN